MPLQSAFTNATPIPPQAGAPYCVSKALPAAEGDLSDSPPYVMDPVALPWVQALSAVVEFAAQGSPTLGANLPYVVLQTDNGDGVWLDVAWCTLAAVPAAGQATTFWLSAGLNATDGSFNQTRAAGTNPSPANGANQLTLGGRFRFVGKYQAPAGSSSSSSSSSVGPGVTAAILVTIKWNPITPR